MEFDQFGPEKILEVHDSKSGMHGFLVIDNTTLGPGKGGIRMTPTVSIDEVARLARAMTWKCSMAELPFGGAKSGIVANDKEISFEKKKEIVQAFSRALKPVCPSLYVAAPDMNMAEKEMRIFVETNGDMKSCTGKPKDMGGLPHELGSTGFGVWHAAKIAAEHIGLDIKKANISIEGFGNVGSFVAKFLVESGAKISCVSDSKGCIHNHDGIDFKKLTKIKKETGSVINYKPGKVIPHKDIIKDDADILIPAAVPDLIKPDDVKHIRAKLIVAGSNIPMRPEVEEMLHKKGVLIIPDFVANAGGVISSYVEYKGGTSKQMFKLVEEKITKNTKLVLEKSKKKKITPREAALEIAKERIEKKCEVCRGK